MVVLLKLQLVEVGRSIIIFQMRVILPAAYIGSGCAFTVAIQVAEMLIQDEEHSPSKMPCALTSTGR